jgi:hypothetical protein
VDTQLLGLYAKVVGHAMCMLFCQGIGHRLGLHAWCMCVLKAFRPSCCLWSPVVSVSVAMLAL